ncbi:MAG: hypothetical protein OEZ59_13370, partial [Deltaproteobacteria bacterium]|nr:hypothetical protein [Deltaproteobacteria bacterium]
MNRLSMEDVRGILAPYETYLQEVFHSAFSDWWELPNRSRLFRRTRATYIHNAAVNHAMDRLGNLPTVDILPRHETAYFVFDNKVLLRFKKADELWNSSNIETQTAISYHDPQETISGLPNIERVEVAYRLNRLETQIAQIMVIARGKDFKPLWKYG